MKKLIVTAAVLACAASIVSAQTVSSKNIVGYTKVQAVAGELTLVALNFETSTNAISELIGPQVPVGTTLHIWHKGSGYETTTKPLRGTWNGTIDTGDAFWIQPQAGSGTNTIILAGEVITAGTNTSVLAAGLDATGYFFPVNTPWADTDLSVALPVGSVLHYWRNDSQDYATYTKALRGTYGGWGDIAGPYVINVAEGFWVQSVGGLTWDESRPYTP